LFTVKDTDAVVINFTFFYIKCQLYKISMTVYSNASIFKYTFAKYSMFLSLLKNFLNYIDLHQMME